MSSATTEQIGDEVLHSYSSTTNPISTIDTYENHTSHHHHPSVNLNDLINRILSLVNERLDDGQQYKTNHRTNSMQPAIYQVLREMKDKIALNNQQLASIDVQPSEQLVRVDNMLIAEGISEQNPSVNLSSITSSSLDQADYQTKLTQIRQVYQFELEKYENHCNDFCSHVVTLLREQSQIRPVSEQEIERMVMIIRKKFSIIQLQLKQSTCEAVMILRSRFLDARRKRRNFSKIAVEVLNEYFYSHLSNPYPSEEVKEELARQCGISVAQVSNWFGNKRIRYKKNINKTQEEANMYAAKIASQAARHHHDYPSIEY